MAHIENLIGVNVPPVVANFIGYSELLNEEFSWIFSHFEVLSNAELLTEYNNRTEAKGFFDMYSFKENFQLEEESYIDVYDEEIDEKRKTRVSKDVSRYLPLGRIKQDYLVVDLRSHNSDRLYNIELGYNAILYAPSIANHLTSLTRVLVAEKVEMEEDGPTFSDNWYERSNDWKDDHVG